MGGSGFLIPGHGQRGIVRMGWGVGRKETLSSPESFRPSSRHKGSFPERKAAVCLSLPTHINRVRSLAMNGSITLLPINAPCKKPTWRTIFHVCISILYMFRTAMCSSSEELLYQCDTWFMSLYVYGRLVCIPDGYLHRVTWTSRRIDTIILLMKGTWLPETC